MLLYDVSAIFGGSKRRIGHRRSAAMPKQRRGVLLNLEYRPGNLMTDYDYFNFGRTYRGFWEHFYAHFPSLREFNLNSAPRDTSQLSDDNVAEMSVNSLVELERNLEELLGYFDASELPPITPQNSSGFSPTHSLATLGNTAPGSTLPEPSPTSNRATDVPLLPYSTSMLSSLENNVREALALQEAATVGTPCYFPSLLADPIIAPLAFPAYSPLSTPESGCLSLAEMISSGNLTSRPANRQTRSDNARKVQYSEVLKRPVPSPRSRMSLRDDASASPATTSRSWANSSDTLTYYGSPRLMNLSTRQYTYPPTFSETESDSTVVPDTVSSGSASAVTVLPRLESAYSMPRPIYNSSRSQIRNILTMAFQDEPMPLPRPIQSMSEDVVMDETKTINPNASTVSDSFHASNNPGIVQRPRRRPKARRRSKASAREANATGILSKSLKELNLLKTNSGKGKGKSPQVSTSMDRTARAGPSRLDSDDPETFPIESRMFISSAFNARSGPSTREPEAVGLGQRDLMSPSSSAGGTNQPERAEGAASSSRTSDHPSTAPRRREKPPPKPKRFEGKYVRRP